MCTLRFVARSLFLFSSGSNCENVVDQDLQLEQYHFCERCDCQWQRRNTTTIKVTTKYLHATKYLYATMPNRYKILSRSRPHFTRPCPLLPSVQIATVAGFTASADNYVRVVDD